MTSVKDSSELDISEVDEVIRKGRSNSIKIGCIKPFVPEEAIVSNEEAKRMQAQRYLRGRSDERDITIFREASSGSRYRRQWSKSRRDDIVYRHVRVVEEPPLPRKVTNRERHTRKAAEAPQSHVRYERRREYATEAYTEPSEIQSAKPSQPLQSTSLAKLDSSKASQSSQILNSTSSPGTAPIAKASAETVMLKGPERTDSEIRKVASEEAERYANGLQKDQRLDSNIRRIAHEEVARYREAERKLEALPRAYAHGRTVSVQQHVRETREESQTARRNDIAAAAPANEATQDKKPRASERKQSVSSSSCTSSQSRTKSEQSSWGPQWRRELSLERRRSSDTRNEQWHVEALEHSRSKVSAPPSNPVGSDKARSTYNVVRGSDAQTRISQSEPQGAKEAKKERGKPSELIAAVNSEDMGQRFSPARRNRETGDSYRERETVERLSVRKSTSPAPFREPTEAAYSEKSTAGRYRRDASVVRSTGTSSRWEEAGSGRPWERGSEEHAAFLGRKRQSHRSELQSQASENPNATLQGANVEYEYKLHTVRPASQLEMEAASKASSPGRAGRPDHVPLEIWQQVPTDPVQREREAAVHNKDRDDAVEWLKKRLDDPKAQLGVDSDGSKRFACSIPYSGSDRAMARSPPRLRRPSPRRTTPPRDDRSRRSQQSTRGWQPSDHSSGPRVGGGRQQQGDVGDDDWPEGTKVIEVWEEVPTKEAARYRQEIAEKGPEEYVVEAWQQVPSDRPLASNVRRDSAMAMPHARRRRERRERLNKASDDSAHVKFASKVDISPTPPGSDESSNAFRRFHDFVGRKASRQQIDGHDSEEKGEDLIAEYERRGRLRSRDSARRKSDYGSGSRDVRDRDETVKPREGQRKYQGRRDEDWRPLQRALSESPSREWSNRKRSSTKGGPPYHPDEKPTASMTTRDGSRSSGRWW